MAVLLKNPDIKPENINPDEINAIIEYCEERCTDEKDNMRIKIQELITEEKVIDKFQKQQSIALPLDFFSTAALLRATEQDIALAVMALYRYTITGSHSTIESPDANALYSLYNSKLFYKRAEYIYTLLSQEARGKSKRKESSKEGGVEEELTSPGFTEDQAEESTEFMRANYDKFRLYTGGMSKELLLYACELSAKAKNELNADYVAGVLRNWHQAGVTSVKAAHDFEAEYYRKKKEQPATASTPTLSEQHPEWNYGDIIGGHS